jgi:hypothetical protein
LAIWSGETFATLLSSTKISTLPGTVGVVGAPLAEPTPVGVAEPVAEPAAEPVPAPVPVVLVSFAHAAAVRMASSQYRMCISRRR